MALRTIGFVLAIVGLGCGSSDGDDGGVDPLPDAGPNDFVVNGTVFGTGARAGEIQGLFVNRDNIGSLHVHGLGRSTQGSTFGVAFPPSVPMEAQNGGTVAVGYIMMTEIDDALDEGLASTEDGEKVIGLSSNHMMVYRAAPFVTVFAWEDAFPAGWACGECQRSPIGGVDSLIVTSCQTVVVDMGSFGSLDACNPFTSQ